jgi:hypothetical protein
MVVSSIREPKKGGARANWAAQKKCRNLLTKKTPLHPNFVVPTNESQKVRPL